MLLLNRCLTRYVLGITSKRLLIARSVHSESIESDLKDLGMHQKIAIKERAQRYIESTGVSLKFEIEDILQCPEEPETDNILKCARMLFSKYPNVDPESLSSDRFELMAKQTCPSLADDKTANSVLLLQSWVQLRIEEIERVTFENVASYEP